MHKNHSVISQDPKMASLTLHLIVIALLASTALTATTTTTTTTATTTTQPATKAATATTTTTIAASTTTTTATRHRGRGAAHLGDVRLAGGVASTTSTEAPTLRAPRQRRPPTTQSIELTVTLTPTGRSRSRSNGRTTTPLPLTTTTTTNTRVLQRRRSSTSSTTTTTTAATPIASRSTRDRGSVRGARQPRDTPNLSVDVGSGSGSNGFIGSGNSIRRSWQSAQPTATHYHAHAPTSSFGYSSISSSSFDNDAPFNASANSNSNSSSISSPTSTSTRGALKTPRMIQRLVAGHIHNAHGHSTYEVSAVSSNSSSSSLSFVPSTTERITTERSASTSTSTSSTSSTSTTRQPKSRSKASSSYRLAKPSSRPRSTSTVATTRFSNPPSVVRSTTPLPPLRSNTPNPNRFRESNDAEDDDEALLNEPDDFDNWDNGILRLSAGSGKESEAPAKKPPKEEQKKTLADQVRDGKYGLIEKELFRRVPKRPGVLSYARNSEVPLDNERNYGGLNEEDIWLAEDHLLVIKGGSLNEEAEDNQQGPWPPIDDYDAPGRQIKLPANPAVPPPFPVQLEPHGPLQLIRDNQLEVLHPAAGNGTRHQIDKGDHQGAAGEGSVAAHPVARQGAIAASAPAKSPPADRDDPAYVYPSPYAPWLLYPNDTVASKGLLRSPPLLGPWLINGLNGNGSFLGGDSPLPANVSDFDEDDPSLYYPPAYSFVYKSNYSNPVPPGPLVPGIVLPPPPDHFTRLEGTTRRPLPSTSSSTTTSTTTSTTSTTTTSTTVRPPVQLPAIRTSYKPKYNGITYLPPPPRQSSPKYVERVPVPVAVPIPIYPVNYTPRPQLVFVPSSTEGSLQDPPLSRDPPLSKSNPIYYEYFEAKRQPGSIKSNVIDDFLATKPPKRHHHSHSHNHNHNHQQQQQQIHQQREQLQHYKASPSPANDVAGGVEVVNITPKPRTAQLQLHAEYEASLGQLLRSNLISPPAGGSSGRFQPPDFDKQPFLPMVNYSADEQDQNAFKAIVYQPPGQRQRHLRVGKQQLQLDPNLEVTPQDSYLPGRHFRVGKQHHQQQQQQQQLQQHHQIFEPQIYSTPVPQFVEDPQQLRPPSPVQANPLQFWQRPPPQFKRVRPSSKQGHPHSHTHYPPYYVPGYPSGPSAGEHLYRLVPVAQHKHWRSNKQQPQQQVQQVQSQPIQVQPQNQGYPDRSVNIGHSLAGDILVNYSTNNQFNPQAELVPQAQLAAPPPPPPPLSYQAQSGQPLWSERERDRSVERSVRQSREQQQQQQQQ